MTSTTNRSFNEIQGMLRKAGVGAGCAFGAAEEIGQAAVWLCRRGVDGVDSALTGLRSIGDGPAAGSLRGHELQFETCSAAVNGPAALDMLAAEPAISALSLAQVDSPLLLIGLAGLRVADQNIAFELNFGDRHSLVIDRSVDDFSGLSIQNGSKLSVTVLDTSDTEVSSHRTDSGIPVQDVLWRECEKLAWKTYVPATAESRAKGAGSSLTDND